MPPTTGSAAEIRLGAGILYVAPLGTTEPTAASSTLDAAWREVGYTESGSTVAINRTSEGIQVAEELDDVDTVNVRRQTTVSFQAAQATRKNLLLVLNSQADGANNATAIEPPDAEDEVAWMLFWKSDDASDPTGWLFRQGKNTGNIEITRNKAPNKALLPVTFSVEKPSGATKPWKVFPNSAGLI